MPHLLLLTGPVGAGKSTTAASWARGNANPTSLVCVDEVRHFVKAGYVSPKRAYTDEAHRQFELARGISAAAAGRYLDAGFNCVVDDLIFPDSVAHVHHQSWIDALDGRPHFLVVLLPTLEVALKRNAARASGGSVSEDLASAIHELMMPWREIPGAVVIDNSRLSPMETVHAMESVLELRKVRSAAGAESRLARAACEGASPGHRGSGVIMPASATT